MCFLSVCYDNYKIKRKLTFERSEIQNQSLRDPIGTTRTPSSVRR